MPALVADRLSFGWSSETLLFTGLSLSLGTERAGLIGANGSGKTTLLRLLLGELVPAAGSVVRHGRILHLAQFAEPAATVADALGIAGRLAALERIAGGSMDPADFEMVGADWDIAERADEALARSGVPGLAFRRPLGSLSGGQATRVRLARVHLETPDLLILDEPTNDLDADGRAALYALVESWRHGLLAVSHDRTLLDRMDRILHVSSLGLKSYGGNYTAYRVMRQAELQAAERRAADAHKQVALVARATQEARERAARRAKSGKRLRDGSQSKMALDRSQDNAENHGSRLQALALRQAAEARTELAASQAELEVAKPLHISLPSTGLPAGRRVLDLRSVTVRHPGAPTPVLHAFSLAVTGPERVALTGPNGAGKSTLLAAAAGVIVPEAGTVRRGVERFALLDQRLADIDPAWTVLDLFRRRNPDLSEHDARAALAIFGFRNTAALVPFGRLSGGQRLRAALAAALTARDPPKLLLLDEPTNHMDLESLEALEAALRGYDGALLAASHDPWFLDAIGVNRTIRLGDWWMPNVVPVNGPHNDRSRVRRQRI